VEEERLLLKRKRGEREVEEKSINIMLKGKTNVKEERFTLQWKVDVEKDAEEDAEDGWGRTTRTTLEGLRRERYHLFKT